MGDAHYLPQPPLPEVPGRRGAAMARGPRGGAAAGSLLSRRLHPAGRTIAAIAFQNKAAVYDLLFRTAAETPDLTIAADPKPSGRAHRPDRRTAHLGLGDDPPSARPRQFVPGGGLSLDGSRWIACKPGFFCCRSGCCRVSSAGSSSKGLAVSLHAAGRLAFFGDLAPLARTRPPSTPRFSRLCAAPNWVVYAKRPFAGPQAVLAFISPATPLPRRDLELQAHRAQRQSGVTFKWKDYRRRSAATGSRP